MTGTKRAQLLTIGIGTAAVVFVVIVASRQYQQRIAIESQTAIVRNAIASQDDIRREMDLLQITMDDLTKTLTAPGNHIPQMAELGDFLQDLSSRATRCGVEPSEIRPGETVGIEGIYTMPLTFTVRGEGNAIYALIREVETMGRLTRIDRFSLKADAEHEGIVEAEVSMRIYYMNL